MAPKKKKELVDERFQAVVLTDSFETRFMPLTAVKPRCLLPLANVPLIEYTLEFLAKAGVNEVFLMCSSHAEQVQQYIEQSKWCSINSPFKIIPIMLLESRSVGDAMRDLDNRGVISGDFLLVSGDVVTNIDFSRAMEMHRRHRENDSNHILTMVLSSASAAHRARSDLDPATFILDAKTNRCVYYQAIPGANKKASIKIDPELMDDIDELVVRNDLIDCHVDICSPLVPQLFQDNFDYQLLRTDFVRGVLNSDIAKKSLYAYITDEYAARVVSWATYKGISQDVLERWSYPLVPDANLLEDTEYTYESNHIYKDRQVVLARLSHLETCTCVGFGTKVGDKTTIGNSIVGARCTIGSNVRLHNSYVWEGAEIGDNSEIEGSIVAAGAKIAHNVKVNVGCVIGYGVVIEEGRTIPPYTRLVDREVSKPSNGFDDSTQVTVVDSDLVGLHGHGYVYESDQDSGSDSLVHDMNELDVSDSSVASISASRKRKAKARRLSLTSAVSTDFVSEDEEELFAREAIDTIKRSMENNHDIDTTLLEINSLRMSMNVSYHEVRRATVSALITRIVHFITTDTLAPKQATEKTFGKWGPLFKRQVFDADDQVDLLQLVQQQCAMIDPAYNQTVLFVALSWLYNEDFVEEDQIYKWWELPQSSATAELVQVRQLTKKWVEWLREAEEESD